MPRIDAQVRSSAYFDAEPEPIQYTGWRVLHKIEGGWPLTPPRMPEVMPPLYYTKVEMTEPIQRMSYNLAKAINPLVIGNIWRNCHSTGRAMTNFNGYIDATGGIPRADYINGRDLRSPLPAYDKPQRVFGGSFIRGVKQGEYIVCTAGIHGIDADAPLPNIETIIKNNWYVTAVNVSEDFKTIHDWTQGQGGHIVFPFIFRGVIEFDAKYLKEWRSESLPDPLKIGGYNVHYSKIL